MPFYIITHAPPPFGIHSGSFCVLVYRLNIDSNLAVCFISVFLYFRPCSGGNISVFGSKETRVYFRCRTANPSSFASTMTADVKLFQRWCVALVWTHRRVRGVVAYRTMNFACMHPERLGQERV